MWQLLDRGSSLVAFRLCFHHNQLKWPRVDGMLLNPIRLVLISWGWVCNPIWLSRIPFFLFSFYFVGSLVMRGLAYSYRYQANHKNSQHEKKNGTAIIPVCNVQPHSGWIFLENLVNLCWLEVNVCLLGKAVFTLTCFPTIQTVLPRKAVSIIQTP